MKMAGATPTREWAEQDDDSEWEYEYHETETEVSSCKTPNGHEC